MVLKTQGMAAELWHLEPSKVVFKFQENRQMELEVCIFENNCITCDLLRFIIKIAYREGERHTNYLNIHNLHSFK